MTSFAFVALGLILIRYFFELCLDGVNAAHVRKHSAEVPKAFREIFVFEKYTLISGQELPNQKTHIQFSVVAVNISCKILQENIESMNNF